LPNPAQPVIFDQLQPRFITAQSTVSRIAPDGAAVVHLFKHLEHTREPADAAELEALLDTAQPGWRELIVERRFLPHMLGSSLLPRPEQGGMAGRPQHRAADLPNVYFAGDWVGPRGYLADATLDSAREAARLALQPADSRDALRTAA
jgi:phytoene dehydrogenase-like protein